MIKARERLSLHKAYMESNPASKTEQEAPSRLPPLSSLPLREGDPPYSAWGLYGPQDELGSLNRLSDAIVAQAAKAEIQSGTR